MKQKYKNLFRPRMRGYFFVMALFCAAALLEGQYWLSAAESTVTILLFLLYAIQRKRRNSEIRKAVESASASLEQQGIEEGPLASAVIRLGDDKVLTANLRFREITGFDGRLEDSPLSGLVEGLSLDWLTSGKSVAPEDVSIGDARFRVYGVLMHQSEETLLAVLYFVDLTELYQVRDEYIRSRPVVSIILIDNYDELTKNLTDNAISSLNAKIGDEVSAWADAYHGLLRKLDRNRYLFLFEKRDLERMQQNRFSILERIREISGANGRPSSISIGIGVDAADFEEGYRFAALGIEMALSRGGDQAVIKDRMNFSFFGGRSKETDYRSKVRSRVTANSLVELITESSHVFIMGHRNADLDSLGAAVGVACLCRAKGRKCNIVLDFQINAVSRFLEELQNENAYADLFISGQDALLLADNRSVLVVVDTNRPDQVEYRPLLDAITKVCVIDHHRRAADYIKPVVNFLETYASSASELVTEILLYAVESKDVLSIEAKALLAGICLDTKFFNVRTGERTFEAAAALRRMGADTTEVKLLMQNDFQNTKAKYQIVQAAQSYRKEIAIAALEEKSTRILAAQAADELLNIAGITASFVMYPDDDQVVISARSIGSANVQVILEALGGGGNAATAGAQMKNITVQEALDQLTDAIDKFYEK